MTLKKIIVAEEREITFIEQEDKTILNSLERENIECHYHCRDGYCGACRVTLNKGEVHYPNGEPLAFVGDNEILPCCSIPVNDIDITIE